MLEQMTFDLAEKTKRDYCCSVCWNHLMLKAAPGRMFTIECAAHGTEHTGFVTKAYVERRRSESRGELAEARHNLAGVMFPVEQRTEQEIMKEIGFKRG
jgi:hypothetical protein